MFYDYWFHEQRLRIVKLCHLVWYSCITALSAASLLYTTIYILTFIIYFRYSYRPQHRQWWFHQRQIVTVPHVLPLAHTHHHHMYGVLIHVHVHVLRNICRPCILMILGLETYMYQVKESPQNRNEIRFSAVLIGFYSFHVSLLFPTIPRSYIYIYI